MALNVILDDQDAEAVAPFEINFPLGFFVEYGGGKYYSGMATRAPPAEDTWSSIESSEQLIVMETVSIYSSSLL